MTREEIREGMLKIIDSDIRNPMTAVNFVKAILDYLDSQGIVIKVERELPTEVLNEIYRNADRYALRPNYADALNRTILERAGYVATIPLVEK